MKARNYIPATHLPLLSSVCQFKQRKKHGVGVGGGVLSTIYNGRFEKTVTFSFWMAFKAQT